MPRKKTEKVVQIEVTEEVVSPIDTTKSDEVVMGEEITSEKITTEDDNEQTTSKKTQKEKYTIKKNKKRITNSESVDNAVSGAMLSASGALSWLEDNRQQVLGGILILLALYLLREFVFGLILIIAGLLLVTGYFEDRD